MTNAVKRIGVLTSGGDAPGMNAAIRAVVRSAIYRGIDCVGIRRGFNGLINGDFARLDENSVNHIINRGGTMLYTARSEEFRTLDGQQRAAATCKLLGLDGIVGVGGDGTFRGLKEFSKQGISVVGVPATIDNDIVCTDYTIGFDTAANTAIIHFNTYWTSIFIFAPQLFIKDCYITGCPCCVLPVVLLEYLHNLIDAEAYACLIITKSGNVTANLNLIY